MEIFTCKYENHQNEGIIGFCLNSKCQHPCQYCYKCLIKVHSDHQDDCIRFTNISELINQYIDVYIQIKQQSNHIYIQIKKLIESDQKRMDENILSLRDSNQLLKTQDYLQFKSSINIIKQYYSQEQQNLENQFVNQLNEIKETLKLKENKNLNQQQVQKIFEIALSLTEEGKHEEALKQYDNYCYSLVKLDRFQEAIHCYDIALYLNPKNDDAYVSKGNSLDSLNQYQEAIDCYDKAISLNSKDKLVYYNKAHTLYQMKQFQQAILFYDKALALNKNPLCYKNKAETLIALGKLQEAKNCFQNALNAGYSDKDYIMKQLKKL